MAAYDNTAAVPATLNLMWAPVRLVFTLNQDPLALDPGTTWQGVTLALGDRVLLVNQTLAKDNGIYEVAATQANRASDADSAAEFVQYREVEVLEGNSASVRYLYTTAGPITLGTTALTFVGAGAFAATLAGAAAYDNTAAAEVTLP